MQNQWLHLYLPSAFNTQVSLGPDPALLEQEAGNLGVPTSKRRSFLGLWGKKSEGSRDAVEGVGREAPVAHMPPVTYWLSAEHLVTLLCPSPLEPFCIPLQGEGGVWRRGA